jgi:uncharacterized damage-inducible protein DinB
MDAQQAKFLVDQYATLMEGEFPATVKVLAAVKDDTRDYKPDEKSRTAWELATHLATSDVWFLDSIIKGKFEFDPEVAKQAEAQFKTVNDVVEFYKKTFPAKLQELRTLSPDKLSRTVDFFGLFNSPAVSLMGFANNHGIHHRGQLAAYLRAMGSKVPAIYGGSADEPFQAAQPQQTAAT